MDFDCMWKPFSGSRLYVNFWGNFLLTLLTYFDFWYFRWRFVVFGQFDGYSKLVTSLPVCSNDLAPILTQFELKKIKHPSSYSILEV